MTSEPRTQHDYGARDVEAARRVLVDLGQVLGTWFKDSIVVIGGWVPDLLLPDADEPHIGRPMRWRVATSRRTPTISASAWTTRLAASRPWRAPGANGATARSWQPPWRIFV